MFWDQENQSSLDASDADAFANTFCAPKLRICDILDESNVQLTDIIDHDYVISELRYGTDQALIKYLTDEKIILELLHIMLTPVDDDGTEELMSFGRASKCCSMIGIKNLAFLEALVDSVESMNFLKTYLVTYNEQYNSLQAQYYKDTMTSIIEIFPEKVIPILQNTSDVEYICSILNGSYHSSVAEILLYILKTTGTMTSFYKTRNSPCDDSVEWLHSLSIPQKLVQMLDVEKPCLVHENVTFVYCEMLRAVKRRCEEADLNGVTKAFYESFYNADILKELLKTVHNCDILTAGGRSVIKCASKIFNVLLEESCPKDCPAEDIVAKQITVVLPGMLLPDRPEPKPSTVFQLAIDQGVNMDLKAITVLLSKVIFYLDEHHSNQLADDSMWLETLTVMVNLANTNSEAVFQALARELVNPLSDDRIGSSPLHNGMSIISRLLRKTYELPRFTCMHDCVARLLTYLIFSKEHVARLITNVFEAIAGEVDFLIEKMQKERSTMSSTEKGFGFRLLLAVRGGILFSPSSNLVNKHIVGKLQHNWLDFCKKYLDQHIQENKRCGDSDSLKRVDGSSTPIDGEEIRAEDCFPEDFPIVDDLEFPGTTNLNADNPFDNEGSPFMGGEIDDPFASTGDGTTGNGDGWAAF
ncbi:hypothetical protein QR680_001429 [Steinernema hermaphroditum]|uniref:Uncharacterized protein n=1 Tax=Steinernema hermaphroditum TaxID=289476 RepID=A0AA39GZV0_9BILA|nr:hypothetical protein QR680_001429 [Steinernema hermaphroditum]